MAPAPDLVSSLCRSRLITMCDTAPLHDVYMYLTMKCLLLCRRHPCAFLCCILVSTAPILFSPLRQFPSRLRQISFRLRQFPSQLRQFLSRLLQFPFRLVQSSGIAVRVCVRKGLCNILGDFVGKSSMSNT